MSSSRPSPSDDLDLELDDDWSHHPTDDLDLGMDTYDLGHEAESPHHTRQVHVTATTVHVTPAESQAVSQQSYLSRFFYYLFCCFCCSSVLKFRPGYGKLTTETEMAHGHAHGLGEHGHSHGGGHGHGHGHAHGHGDMDEGSKSRDGHSLFIIDVDSEEEAGDEEETHTHDDADGDVDDTKRTEGRELCDRIIRAMEARSFVEGVWSDNELRVVFFEIGATGVARLCKTIMAQANTGSSSVTVTRLELGMTSIGPTGSLIPIRDLLLTHRSLRHLSIWGSGIADKGALSIAKGLSQNQTLHTLALNNNAITDKGIKHIADALASNRTLTSLDCSGNPLTDKSARYLTTSLLSSHPSIPSTSTRPHPLEYLNLSSCSFTSKACTHLAQLLCAPSCIETLDLSSNRIDDSGCIALIQALENNQILTQLNLHSNQLGPDSVKAVQLSSSSTSHHRVITLDTSQTAALDELERGE